MRKFLNRLGLKKRILAVAFSVTMMTGAVSYAALPEIISIDDIQTGMTGKGYTVIDPSGEIRSFDVKVVGRMGGGKMDSSRILVDVSGPVIEEAGGAISGMSGSPIYINGKLAGALSASLKDMYINKRILITPIEDMLKIWEYPDTKNKTSLPQVDLKKSREEAEKAKAEFEKKIHDIKVALNGINPENYPDINNPNLADNLRSDWNNPNLADNLRDDYHPAEGTASEEDNNRTDEKPDNKEPVSEEDTKANGPDNAPSEGDRDNTKTDTPDVAVNEPTGQYAQGYAPDGSDQAGAEMNVSNNGEAEEKAMLLAAGFSSRGIDFIQEKLKEKGFRINEVSEWNSFAGPATIRYDASLEPGSPVGVAAAVGDYSLGAIGTVTAVDEKRILAFGHPFSHRGNVNYFMTGSEVISTAHGPLNGMKLGYNSSLIGRINQDRANGIAGILGEFPQNIPVIVTINDVDLAKSITYNSLIAYDEDLVPALTTAMVYDAMGSTINRDMGGTARVHFAVRTNMAEEGRLDRSNMFYNGSDVGKPAVSELTEIMNTICNNKDRESDIYDIKVDVFIEGKRLTASLLSAVPSQDEVLPGEKITFTTTIKPYRGENVVLEIPYTVPRNQLPGVLNLDIHGGGLINVAKLLLAQQGGDSSLEEDKSIKTETILKDMVESNHNNDIVIEPALAAPMTEAQQKEAIKQAIKQAKRLEQEAKKGKKPEKQEPATKVTSSFATDYVIDNVIHTSLRVVEKKK